MNSLKKSFLIFLPFLLLFTQQVGAVVYGDSAIFQGVTLRLDIANSVLAPALSKGKVQSYEMGLNVDLLHRYFPTIEGGYAFTKPLSADGGYYEGKGGFMKVGLDLSMQRKHRDASNFFLMGFRIASAFQNYQLTQVEFADPYWRSAEPFDFDRCSRADVWGEIVMGVQVSVVKGFCMGWNARLGFLFTRKGTPMPYYIPGYGYREDMAFGFNYYLGWKF